MSMFNSSKTKAVVSGTIESAGKVVKETSETTDVFNHLQDQGDSASVSASYALGRDFNSEKVTFHVTLRCSQHENVINEAGKLAFFKAVEFVGDACANLGWTKTE